MSLGTGMQFRMDFARVIDHIKDVSVNRSKLWHKGEPWTILESTGAMCGEAGEASNVAKKIRREQQGMLNLPNGPISAGTMEELDKKLGQELADTFLYLILVAANRNIDLADAIVNTFNEKSVFYGFPQRL